MTVEGLSAWLLHARRGKGSSTEVFFFTHESGLVRAFCSQGRRSHMRATLQPFTPLWLTLKTKHYGVYADKVEVKAPAKLLAGEQMFAGLYLNELLYRMLKPEAAEPRLYALYEYSIDGLLSVKTPEALQQLLRRFEFKLIDFLGYGVSFTRESEHSTPILPHQSYEFNPNAGFTISDEGLQGTDILAIAAGKLDTKSALKTAKYIMRIAIDNILEGAEIYTRVLYQTQLKGRTNA